MGVGGELFTDLLYRAIYIGFAGDVVLVPINIESPEGNTDVTVQTAVLRSGWAGHLGADWDYRLGASLGVQRYEFRTDPAAGYAGTDAAHVGLYAGGDLTVTRGLGDLVGAFVRVRMGSVSAAPRLQLNEPVRLGAPSWGSSIGVAFQ